MKDGTFSIQQQNGKSRLYRVASELDSTFGISAFSHRGTWSNMAAILLDGRFGMRWNREFFIEAYREMRVLLPYCGENEADAFLCSFFTAFQAFRQLLPSLDMLWSGGLNAVTRTQTLSLPTYSSLLEGCYSNLARAVFVLLSRRTGKDYSAQSTLKRIADVLRSNSFTHLRDMPDANLRNAVNHGGVVIANASGFASCKIRYTYVENGNRCSEELSSTELESKLFDAADSLRGAILGVLAALTEHGEADHVGFIADEYVCLMYRGFALGDEGLWCQDANSAVMGSQVNFTFEAKDTDRDALYSAAERIFVEASRLLPEFERFTIAFSNPRLTANFLRVYRRDVEAFKSGGTVPGELISTIKAQGEYMWFDPNDEDINMAETLFYRFPFYDDETMSIFDIEDASMDDRKRLRAKVFTHGKESRNDVIPIALSAIEWVKQLRNPPSPAFRIKHGDMAADCVYLDVYREELNKDRSLVETNENFICSVEYCPNKEFQLAKSNGFIKYLHGNAEQINEDTEFLWRDRNNLTHRNEGKAGRSDPCPCGSGKKYKKCCIGKGIYD